MIAFRKFITGLQGFLNESPPVNNTRSQRIANDVNDAAPGRKAVLIIDASPSMEETDWPPSRFTAAKEAAKAYIARLVHEQPNSEVAIVTYSSNATRQCGLVSIARTEKLFREIDGAVIGNGTNIAAGIEAARALLKHTNGELHAVLLTDGHSNVGPDARKPADKLKKTAVIDVVGIGGSPSDVDEALLKDIASVNPDGSKRYRWIGDRERLVKHFHSLAGRIARS